MDDCKEPLLKNHDNNYDTRINGDNDFVLNVDDSALPVNCRFESIDGPQTQIPRLQNGYDNIQCYPLDESERPNPFDFLGFEENPCCSFHFTGVDPFKNDTAEIVGLYEWIKILVLSPLALLRVLLMGLALAVGYLFTRLALAGWKDRHNPMPRWRCIIMLVTRFCARCILFSFGYHWIRRTGKPAPREVAPIVVANHISFTDPIFFFYELFPSFVASESHDQITFVGTVIRAMQVIYVDRTCPASRKRAISEIKRKASYNDFPRVMLFPEGTTSNGRTVISFRIGAFLHGVPIQPVVIRYPHVHFDQSWGTISLVKLMFRMFTQFHNFMEVEYLPVIFPEPGREPAVFAKKVRNEISKTLNVVQTEHSYGDVILVTKASDIGLLGASSYMVEMANLERVLHLSIQEALGFLDKYIVLGPDESGRVNMENFLLEFGLGKCKLAEQIFGFIDSEKEGMISFKQYLYVTAYLVKHPKFHELCESAFQLTDKSRKGFVSKEEVEETLKLVHPNPTENDVCRLFKEFDVDNDGRISSTDVVMCLEGNPLLIALWKSQFS
eukprot:TRINITY_DN2137_c0_g1_i1.p1 TRINITY_DN2137_c0_g1~~TRINITY_DN2137_c0_g1_i1.p1  ORF type:complete len:555 (-),score=78.18 TRINITY_DN2137_c0_g1_i1:77-1741(-)